MAEGKWAAKGVRVSGDVWDTSPASTSPPMSTGAGCGLGPELSDMNSEPEKSDGPEGRVRKFHDSESVLLLLPSEPIDWEVPGTVGCPCPLADDASERSVSFLPYPVPVSVSLSLSMKSSSDIGMGATDDARLSGEPWGEAEGPLPPILASSGDVDGDLDGYVWCMVVRSGCLAAPQLVVLVLVCVASPSPGNGLTCGRRSWLASEKSDGPEG
mmetsp:Transcript_31040/g.90189  ORF Transcript_31040/g.90189 Transcript_31040/m.90189 type:complete len:213 (+) Transcript_31040:171-809(+)